MDKLALRYKISALIAREIAETISENERIELKNWISESDSNNLEYLSILKRIKDEGLQTSAVNIKREWNTFKKSIAPKRAVIKWWYSAAAALLAGVMIFFFYNRELITTQSAGLKQQPILKAQKAILVLSNGRRVSISDTTSSTISAANGLTIVSKGNRLLYQQQAASENAEEELNTLIIPRGAEYQLKLADGTIAWLNSNSSLTYPVNFKGDLRNVSMSGEVCFDVTKRMNQPFVVKTGDVSVRVLGTYFNIEAYKGEPVTTTLARGKIEVSDGNSKKIILPNQQAIISSGQFDVKQVYAEDYVSWVEGVFNFHNTKLDDIMQKLARWYDVDVEFETSSSKNARITFEIKRPDNIASILSAIEQTGRVKFEIKGKKVTVKD
jgi:transmembrane sensor